MSAGIRKTFGEFLSSSSVIGITPFIAERPIRRPSLAKIKKGQNLTRGYSSPADGMACRRGIVVALVGFEPTTPV